MVLQRKMAILPWKEIAFIARGEVLLPQVKMGINGKRITNTTWSKKDL